MTGLIGYQLVYSHPEVLKALISAVSLPLHGKRVWASDERDQKLLAIWDNHEARKAELLAQNDIIKPPNDKHLQERLKRIACMTKEEYFGTPGKVLMHFKTNEEIIDRLGAIKVPTLLLFGGQDILNPPELVLQTFMAIPGAKAVIFQDEGHLLAHNFELFGNEIKTFLDQLKSPPKP